MKPDWKWLIIGLLLGWLGLPWAIALLSGLFAR